MKHRLAAWLRRRAERLDPAWMQLTEFTWTPSGSNGLDPDRRSDYAVTVTVHGTTYTGAVSPVIPEGALREKAR